LKNEETFMSVSSIGGISDPYQSGNVRSDSFQKVRADFQQLTDAFASGNLDQARQAVATLQSDLPSGASNSPIGKALNAVEQALQSGNLSAAQQAFAALSQGQGVHHHRHHHHQSPGASAASANTTTPTDPTSGVGTVFNTSA
jgi:hypothetical protein